MTIDITKLRSHLRTMRHQDIFAMLDEAVGMLSKTKLEALVRRFISPAAMEPGSTETAGAVSADKPCLLARVSDFAERSRRGDYYQSFAVNSKNFMDKSNGTTAWIVECHRLLDRCVACSAVAVGRSEALAAFEILFDLIDGAVSCDVEILFFADEGGMWSLGIDWKSVFESWATCVAHLEPDDAAFERRVAHLVRRYGDCDPRVSMDVALRIRSAARASGESGTRNEPS